MGGPFPLATAAIAGARVQAVGVIAESGPFQLVPGVLDELSDGDKVAEKLLPGNQRAACEGFVEGFDLKAIYSPSYIWGRCLRSCSQAEHNL